MSRAIKWTIPFVSLANVACHIDIYKDGYSGDIIELSPNNNNAPGIPAADPFIIEEDDSEDLLSVIRYKTAYLRMIETTYNGLVDLYPETNTEHYVKFYYGDTLMFAGYMKAQTFDNDWAPAPRQIEFTIVSPLGLADGMYFSKDTDPGFRSLAKIMYEVMNGLNTDIGSVIFPDPSDLTYCALQMYLCTNVILPEDGEYAYSRTVSDLFSARSYAEFLEGLCHCFGLIVHDYPTSLFFTRFDYDGLYSYISKTRLYQEDTSSKSAYIYGNAEIDLSEYIEISGNDNQESVLLPLSKIDVSYEGGFFSSFGIPWDRCSRTVQGSDGGGWDIAKNTPLNSEISSEDFSSSLYVTTSGLLSATGVLFAAAGEDSMTEMILFYNSGSLTSGTIEVVKWTICERPLYAFRLCFDGKEGSSISDMSDSSMSLHVMIQCGSKYYSTSDGWTTTESTISVGAASAIIPVSTTPPYGYPIIVTILATAIYCDSSKIYAIQNLHIESYSSAVGEYVYGDNIDKETIEGSASDTDGSVSVLFSPYIYNLNSLRVRDGISEAIVSVPAKPTYTYLTLAQNRLQIKVKGTLPDFYYFKKIAYWTSGWLWRIIAVSFDPWNDEYTLTLHRSSVLES